jgi:hypothetical protein
MASWLTLLLLCVWIVPAHGAATNNVSLAAIADLTILEDAGSTNRAFHILTLGGAAAVMTATSSVPALIPNPTVAYTTATTGTNNGTLTFQPAANLNGTATITVWVTNDLPSTNSVSFDVTVTPVNDAPTFSLSTNNLFIYRTNGPYSSANFATNIFMGGATNETSQTVTFSVTTTFAAGFFSTAPTITPSGTLAFEVATNKYGTNTVTVVMRDSGGTDNRGKDSSTNTFTLSVAYLNYPPIITGLSATNHILENAAKTNFTFTGWDLDQTALTASVSCSSTVSNILTPTVALTSAKTNFSLTLTTKTNAYGTGVVSVVLSDGTLKVTNNVTVEVQFVNQPPYSSKFAKLTILEDAVTNLSFTVIDFDGSVSNITATGKSSNGGLVNDTNLVFSGAGTNRTLQITPTANSNGLATISVVCTDTNGASSTNSFELTITAVNDAPSFNLTTNLVVVGANAGLRSVANFATNMSVGPPNEAAQTSSFTAKSASTASFRKLEVTTTGTLNYQLATNVTGFFPIQLTLQDSGGTASGGKNVSATKTFYIVATNVPSGLQISAPASVTVAQNKSTNVTVTLVDKDRENVTVTATSSAGGLTALLSGVGKTRALAIKPVYPFTGSATITLLADDGLTTASNSIAVTVTAYNYAPTVSAIDNLSILENSGKTNLAFTVSDLNYDETNTTVTAIVLNTNLVTASIISTNYTNRFISITPLTNASGSSVIRLLATDTGGNAVSNSFVLTVVPVNQKPSFALNTNAYATLGSNYVFVSESGTAKAVAQKLTNFLTSILPGPTNESKQKVSFYVTSSSNNFFAILPAISATGDLTFKPALNATGSVSLVIYAQDNGGTSNGGVDLSTTNTVTMVATNSNQGPEVGKLATSLKINEDSGATNITLSVTDVDTVLTNLHISATCDKTNLANVTATNTGSQIYLTITPVTNLNSATKVSGTPVGSATIKVLVDDGAITNTNSIVLTINAVNDAPTFSLVYTNIVAPYFLSEQVVSNVITNVVVGPTTDETNQTWTPVVTILAEDAVKFVKAPAIDKYGTLRYTVSTNSGDALVSVKVKDNGGTANGGVDTSITKHLNIAIADNPFPTVAGSYSGLFLNNTNVQFDRCGFIQFTVDNSGAYAGYLLKSGASNKFTGQFDIDGVATLAITNQSLQFLLSLDFNGTESISGSVTNTSANWKASVLALRSVYGTETIVPAVGDYIFTITGAGGSGATVPAGDGVLRVNVDDTGLVALGGQLADGTVVTQRVAMTKYAEWPLYLPAYNKGSNGVVLSWVIFNDTNSVNAVNSNNVVWVKTAGASSTNYSGGFTNATMPLASTYFAYDGLWLTGAKVILGGGNLATPITNSVNVVYDTVTVTTNNCNLKLAIDPATGLVSGTFVDPGSSRTNSINGAILQMSQEARGYFMGTNASGYFLLK